MIIDIHAHLWYSEYEQGRQNIIKACELYNLSRVYISCINQQNPGCEDIQKYNRITFEFMRDYPGVIGGFCYINPNHEKSLDYLRTGIEDYGMSGMKIWCDTLCDDPKVYPLVEKCIDYGIPVLAHAYYKTFGQGSAESVGTNIANLAGKYPRAKIIMAHLGGNCYHGLKAIRECKNVWSDFSGSGFRRDDLDYGKEQIGAERLLFGTDSPDYLLDNIGQVEEADFTKTEKELVYYKNAEKILDRNFRL